MIPARTGTAIWLIWATVLTGAVAYASWFYPGVMSFDAAYAWWQARGGETTDLQAPMMMRLWQICDALLPGPGLLFLLHLAIFWSGLGLIATRLRAGLPVRIGFILLAACAPVCFVLFTHVWTDVALMAALTFAVGALLAFRDTGRFAWLSVATLALFYALGVRLNAAPAILPFAFYGSSLALRARRKAYGTTSTLVFGTAAMLVLGVAAFAVNRDVDRHISFWPSLQLCDLAAMSAATDEMLVPAFAQAPDVNVEVYRQAYRSWSCLPLYAGTRVPILSWTGHERRALFRSWLSAIVQHPIAYLSHRSRLSLNMLGTHDPDWPYELIFINGNFQYRDNPPIEPNHGAMHAFWMRAFHAGRSTLWLAAWPYLLLALVALIPAWRRRGDVSGLAAFAVLSSGLLYALPYFFLTEGAELRYLGWSCLSALIGAALLWAAPREHQQERAISLGAYPPAP